MFDFLRPRPKDQSDPLETPRTASAWFRQLPAHDVIGRQQHVIRAFEAMDRTGKPIDLDRVSAIEWLDAALGPDRDQLMRQYAEHAAGSAPLAEHIWRAAYDSSQGFIRVYKKSFDQAGVSSARSAQWKRALPRLLVRLIHCYGIDAKLRVIRSERWIPAKWQGLHRLYRRAVELHIERMPMAVVGAEHGALPRSIEQEYLVVLLTHRLNTGSLAPGEIDWAGRQLLAWCPGLLLEPAPRSSSGFCVDIAGGAGLVHRAGTARNATLRYLDTAPVFDQLERAIAALRQSGASDSDPAELTRQQRLAVLVKLRPALFHGAQSAPDRNPRTSISLAADVRIGLPQICGQHAIKGDGDVAFEAATTRVPGRTAEVASVAHHDGERNGLPRGWHAEPSEPLWRVEDRSAGGLRLSASGGVGQSLTLGALVGVRERRAGGWVLGVVRRLNRASNEIEAGVSVIAKDFVAVTLHAKRYAREDMGFVVDGIDVSTIGARFDGLYLPPPSRPDNPVSMKTLVIPTSEYAHGRSVILITARSVYTVALHKAFEQRPEWTWAAIEIVAKTAR